MQEMQEAWVWFLGWEDPLENGNPLHCFCLEKPENKLIKTLNLGFPGDSLERIHLPMQEIQV